MNEFVTIPKQEYEKLLQDREMLEDIQAYDKAKKDMQEGMPIELVERLILENENPLKIYRE